MLLVVLKGMCGRSREGEGVYTGDAGKENKRIAGQTDRQCTVQGGVKGRRASLDKRLTLCLEGEEQLARTTHSQK